MARKAARRFATWTDRSTISLRKNFRERNAKSSPNLPMAGADARQLIGHGVWQSVFGSIPPSQIWFTSPKRWTRFTKTPEASPSHEPRFSQTHFAHGGHDWRRLDLRARTQSRAGFV